MTGSVLTPVASTAVPIYEYRCTECDERFEIEQSIKEDALTTLAGDNHEHQLKKVFSPIGISFKGGGFYKNDARGSKSKNSTKEAGTSSESSSGSSGETSSAKSTSSDSSSSSSSSDSSSSGSGTAPSKPTKVSKSSD